jgi:hypothetical protein
MVAVDVVDDTLTISPADLEAAHLRVLSYHEAAHAVVAMILNVPVVYATLRPRYDDSGHVEHGKTFREMTIASALLIALAGPAAQHRVFPLTRLCEEDGVYDSMSRFDMELARSLLGAQHGSDYISERVTVELARWRQRADLEVNRHWAWIARVATALQQQRHLSGDEIASLRNAPRKPHLASRQRADLEVNRWAWIAR